jgi:hypothetical protein
VLDPFDIEGVSTRPADGPYFMFVIGRAPEGFIPPGYESVVPNSDTCERPDIAVGWVGERDRVLGRRLNDVSTANLVLGAFGASNGLVGSITPTDCQCGWGGDCERSSTELCTQGTADANEPTFSCAPPIPQDEVAHLLGVYGARPSN